MHGIMIYDIKMLLKAMIKKRRDCRGRGKADDRAEKRKTDSKERKLMNRRKETML